MNYKEKLKDPRWQKKRLEIMQRDNFTCQICGATDKPLVVHHKSYKRCHGEPWRCPDSDLITICEDCHAREHGKHKYGIILDTIDGENFFDFKLIKPGDIPKIKRNVGGYFKKINDEHGEVELIDMILFLTKMGLPSNDITYINLVKVGLHDNGWEQVEPDIFVKEDA